MWHRSIGWRSILNCPEFDVTLQQAALQFPMRHEAVQCVVVGCRSSDSLLENIFNFDNPIPDEAWARVDSLIAKYRKEDSQ